MTETFYYTDLYNADGIGRYLADFFYNEHLKKEIETDEISETVLNSEAWLTILLLNRLCIESKTQMIYIVNEKSGEKYLVEINKGKITKMYFNTEQYRARKYLLGRFNDMDANIEERVYYSLIQDIKDEKARKMIMELYISKNKIKLKMLGIIDLIKERELKYTRMYAQEQL